MKKEIPKEMLEAREVWLKKWKESGCPKDFYIWLVESIDEIYKKQNTGFVQCR